MRYTGALVDILYLITYPTGCASRSFQPWQTVTMIASFPTNANARLISCENAGSFILSAVQWGAFATCAVLAGCTGAQEYVDAYAAPSPTVNHLTVCHGYGCRWMTNVRIEPFAQAEFARLFEPVPRDAKEERRRLGRAIALFEIKVGAAVGTSHDRYAATTLNDDPGQLDCIDETVNTTTYLRLLKSLGFMRYHAIGRAAQRGSISGFAFNDFITNTAVIVESATGAQYAVDSYFYGNGREPKIMPLAEWRKNWRPGLDDPNLTPVLE